MRSPRPSLAVPFVLALACHIAAALCLQFVDRRPDNPPPESPWQGALRLALGEADGTGRRTPDAPTGTLAAPAPAAILPPEPTPSPPDPFLPIAPTGPVPRPEPADPVTPAAPSADTAVRPAPSATVPSPATAAGRQPESVGRRAIPPGTDAGSATRLFTPVRASIPPRIALVAPVFPRYPLLSRLRAEQGVVVVRVTLQLDGRVTDVGVESSCGFPALDRAAVTAVERAQWQVSQGDDDQGPGVTQVVVRVPIAFRLTDQAPPGD